ncbi:hypothetical protein CRE_17381 [Caenorhabditis remanei]|uniref:DUF38 domain-containing protein n=1 Tax=Caenorhabditis remanei TaxID=31234 RepID=E3N217_CAERE|nr:hypothetical protein CRE_17381 [Caenorhabditis remanei]
MPLPLSYPGLKCILENLEAVKRAHIIGRSPGLQKIDKLIPLCLENFYVGYREIIINKLSIKFEKDVKFGMNRIAVSRKGLKSRNETMKKLINFFICERSKIHVNNLNWNKSLLPDFLPVDLKFRVNSLTFDTLLPFIDSRSFPLKTMVTYFRASLFDNLYVTSAETLHQYLPIDRIVTVEDLKKLNNKKVVFDYCSSSRVDMVPLIKYHFETKQDVRTIFVISTHIGVINKMLREFEHTFREYINALDDVNKRFIPGSPQFSIPINNESRIQVYAIEDPEDKFPYNLIVKPVSEVSGL